MDSKIIFIVLAGFSILLFSLVATKRTFIAQLLSPGLHEPFVERKEDMEMWLRPY